MQKFDALKPDTPLFGPHFLEASAGTGKTFAIEQVVARLIMAGVPLEEILVVTFTRAATRELRLRIRANLAKIASTKLWSNQAVQPNALHKIQDALALFESAQIFTIHGFCQRMLGELPSTGAPFDAALKDFFRFTLSKSLVSPEQLGIALRTCGSAKELGARLRQPFSGMAARTYPELRAEFERTLSTWSGPRDAATLLEAFETQRVACKAAVKGNFAAQLRALAEGSLGPLIRERGSLFAFLAPENQRLRMKDRPEPFAFFEWGRLHVLPLIEEATDPEKILCVLRGAWKPVEEKILREEGPEKPDDLLVAMQNLVKADKETIQRKYRAVLIDEFQDTDPLQWDIFQTLFLEAETLYLIGDPKQSIYRFRSADVYTYLSAKQAIAVSHHYYLDTNYRSSRPLLRALNRLFDREWLQLPKLGEALPYLPVQPGRVEESEPGMHCVLFEDAMHLYAFVTAEIQRLYSGKWSSFAVLVKDRSQAAAVKAHLERANIPVVAKNQEPLTETFAFQAIEELFAALQEPWHSGKAKTVFAGPFGRLPLRELATLTELPALCRALHFSPPSAEFYADFCQTFELLFAWEQKHGFSFHRFFAELRLSDEPPQRYRESETEGVQILTMHSSKGLEFDVVFALGVAAKSPRGDEELEAEKLRQLYVTLTRAKQKLYLPIHRARGLHSPIERFCERLGEQWETILREIPEASVQELVAAPPVAVLEAPPKPVVEVAPKAPPTPSSYILSFTALARPHATPLEPLNVKPLYTLETMPRGAETGVLIHGIFERIFTERIDIQLALQSTSLAPWTEAIVQGIHDTLNLQLPMGFCLRDISPETAMVETEFLFQQAPNYLKGFIDLLFVHEGKLYFVDWKTNWLTDYSPESMLHAMQAHDYFLQAQIYREALTRVWDGPFGGALYFFVRGPAVFCVPPEAHGSLD